MEELASYELNPHVSALHRALVTEANCPEILRYEEEIVETLKMTMTATTRITRDRLRKLQRQNSAGERDEELITFNFRNHFYDMDVERIKYAIARYLRIRLQKIEQSLEYIINDLQVYDRLSEHEKRFATRLQTINDEHLEESFLRKLVSEETQTFVRSNEDLRQHSRPDLNVSIETNFYIAHFRPYIVHYILLFLCFSFLF